MAVGGEIFSYNFVNDTHFVRLNQLNNSGSINKLEQQWIKCESLRKKCSRISKRIPDIFNFIFPSKMIAW